jgi:glutamine cyclotransferase
VRYRYSVTWGLGAAALGLSLLAVVNDQWAHLSCDKPVALGFDVADRIVRSEPGFTQGLVFHNGRLYESTGRVGGTTRLNTISLTGEVSSLAELGTELFGEGLTIIDDEIIQLTWRDHKVLAYDVAGNLKRTMHNPNEGWGLAHDGTALI